jgi:hypothetical protein
VAAVFGGMVMVALAGCGGATPVTLHGSTASTPSPMATAQPGGSPSAVPPSPAPPSPAPPAPVATRLLVVSDTAGQGGTVPVELVRDDGSVLATDRLPAAEQWSVSAGPDGAYWVAGGRLHRLDATGHSSDLGAVENGQNGRIAVSPDGQSWIYATSSASGQEAHTNRLWRGGIGQASHLLAERVSDPNNPTPGMPVSWIYALKSWTAAGVLAVREPAAGCGCGAFDMETVSGNALIIDPDTGASAPLLTDQSCPFSGSGADAAVVCFHSAKSGSADELRVLRHDGTTQRFTLSGTTAGGDARFDPSGTTLAYATTPSTDCGAWTTQTTLRVLDLGSGDAHAVGALGLQPQAWLSSTLLAGTVAHGDADGAVVSVDVRTGSVHTLMSGRSLYVVGAVA